MKLLKKSLVITTATGISYLIAFLFHPIIGRLLGPEKYGLFGVGNTIMWITSLFLMGTFTNITKMTSHYKTRKEEGKTKYMLAYYFKRVFIIGIIIFLTLMIFNKQISDVLGGELESVLKALSITLPALIIAGIIKSYLKGIVKIKKIALYSVLNPTIRLISGIILIKIGLDVFGATTAFTISLLSMIILFAPDIMRLFKKESKKMKIKTKYSNEVMLTNIFTTLIIFIDLFFIKKYTTNTITGLYTTSANLSKAMFIAYTSITTVFFPEIVKSHTTKKNKEIKKKYAQAMGYTLLITLGILLVYLILPEQAITILYSKTFVNAAPILRILATGYAFNNLLMINMYTLWAVNESKKMMKITGTILILDLILLFILVPIYGFMSAAITTTSLLGVLFLISSIIIISKFKN